MGFLVNSDVSGHVFIVNGDGALCNKRKAMLERYGARPVEIKEKLATLGDLTTLGRADADHVVDGVFVVRPQATGTEELESLWSHCKRLRIPLNVCEHPELCTFSLPSVFEDEKFQLAVTTNGMGCRLANRVKRTCVSALPSEMGKLCANIGSLRNQYAAVSSEEDEDDAEQTLKLNELVTNNSESRKQKLRWLSQMVEYYPLEKLKTVDDEDLTTEMINSQKSDTKVEAKTGTSGHIGRISLVGAGPGSIELLTTGALQEINSADYVLADKLVPEEVLSLVPRNTPIFIARKFPGNAERAQEELLEIGLAQLEEGKHVVRLKQGDPYIYGRGLEEYIYFSDRGFTPKIVPGITSALSAPVIAGIAPTHRGYADQVLVCTGTGRAGKLPDVPEYVDTRTTIFLMALHRIKEIADLLMRSKWPVDLPVATIERASCPDQRIVRSSLQHIAEALESVGSRPPGLLVVGRACGVIHDIRERWIVEE